MIDAHQHFWHPKRGDYSWMPKDDKILCRPYGPLDLAPEMAAVGVTQSVIIQAAPSIEETEYILGIADVTPTVAGVVGWVDFNDPKHSYHLDRLAEHPKFKGVRPMIQDIPDPNWMLGEQVAWAFRYIVELDLTFDALGLPIHLDKFLTLFTRYPQMHVVIDHCMKPEIERGEKFNFDTWADGMSHLALETNAHCKLSGLITEDKKDWSVENLRPYASHILEIFGPDRTMWGSDWPVCKLRGEYKEWHGAAKELTQHLTEVEIEKIFGGTA